MVCYLKLWAILFIWGSCSSNIVCIWSTFVGVIYVITLTDFVFKVDALFERSNCSIFFVKVWIKSLLLFEGLSVIFLTSTGLKIGRFLSRCLSKKWGVTIWRDIWWYSSLSLILSSWEERVPRIRFVKLFYCWRFLQSFKVVVRPSLSLGFIVLNEEAIISVFWEIIWTSSKGGWFETIVLLDIVFQICHFWNILTSRKG